MKKSYVYNCILAVITAAVVCGGRLPAQASSWTDENLDWVDIDYSGPLDQATLQPSSLNGTNTMDTRVPISEGIYYDQSRSMFVFPLSDGVSEVLCTANNGMLTREAVRITLPETVNWTLYRDGEPVTDASLSSITAAGDYQLEVTTGSITEYPLSFSITGKSSGRYGSYYVPQGFLITNATLDGQPIAFSNSAVIFTNDGDYVVEYECPRNERQYTLELTVDRVPPAYTFTGVENGRAKGPVTIEGYEQGDVVTVTLDGSRITTDGTLRRSGDYVVTATDPAGNSSTYGFTILIYFDSNSILFLAAIAAAVIVLVVYLFIRRKRLRVR